MNAAILSFALSVATLPLEYAVDIDTRADGTSIVTAIYHDAEMYRFYGVVYGDRLLLMRWPEAERRQAGLWRWLFRGEWRPRLRSSIVTMTPES